VGLHLRDIVLASLAAVPSACEGPPTHFEVDGRVEHFRAHANAKDCEFVCELALNDSHGKGHDNWHIDRLDSCEIESEPDTIHVTCSGTYRFAYEGRRPLAGLALDEPRAIDGELGACLAELAYLEAASIVAFSELATQLERLVAPAELIDRCRAAAVDERRHADLLAALSRRHGGEPREPLVQPRDAPSLLALARHNAVEGCVLESFAALIACVRAATADDADLRAAYRGIAEDELRHGQLAWDIDAWVLARLHARARARVLAARSLALAELPARARSLASPPLALQRLEPEMAARLAQGFAQRIRAAERELARRRIATAMHLRGDRA
jgi:hypothetical protein